MREWLYAFLFMLALSVMTLSMRFSMGPIFNLAFEICIFYIPTAILFAIVVHSRTRKD